MRHPVSLIGAFLAIFAAVVLAALTVMSAAGLFDGNPYVWLVVFTALPAVLLVGLVLILVGLRLARRALAAGSAPGAWPVLDLRRQQVRHALALVLAVGVFAATTVLLAGYGSVRYMESPAFCGQVCHQPMHPQFTAWQQGPHAQVSCAACHTGRGAGSFVHEKVAGVRRLVHLVTNDYPRPIPSGADMPAALLTCGNCHDGRRSLGEPIRETRRYGDDEANTEAVNALRMHVGGPGAPTTSGRAIHWHADPSVKVEYVATDAERQTIPYVKVTDANGGTREYVSSGTPRETLDMGASRVMSCVDCHNAVAHRISPTAEQAVDQAIAAGRIDRSLPFVRRESVRLLNGQYASEREALATIERELLAFYATARGPADQAAVGRAAAALGGVFRRNVFPDMKVTFGAYPDHNGHRTSEGCFRCHDGRHSTSDGAVISSSCAYCHSRVGT